MRFLAALFLSCAALPAQGDIEALIDRARAAPAEFAADALIRLAESGKVDKEKRRGLLEEAFALAASAQQPWKKRAVAGVRGGHASFLDRVFQQGLDANSLRSRAVRAMAALDGPKARQMFLEMTQPTPGKAACRDALVYDVSAFYEALAEVAERGFTKEEIAEDEPFKLISGYVRGLVSPVQVAPAARLLASATMKREHLEALTMAFSGALAEVAGDDRSFSYSVSQQGGAGQAVAALAARCAKLEIPAGPLVEAYRAYLARHLRAVRCADGGEAPAMASGMALSREQELALDPVRFFNEVLRVDPVRPLEGEEIRPEKVEGTAEGVRSCLSEGCQRLAGLYRGLIIGPNGAPLGPQSKASAEWQAKVKEYLAALAEWKDEPGGTAGNLFQQKCSLYSELVNVVPNGDDRIAVLRAFLAFLTQNSYQRESRGEWFLPVNSLVARVSLDPLGLGEMWRDLRGSADPVVSLYAELEEVAPRPPGSRIAVF